MPCVAALCLMLVVVLSPGGHAAASGRKPVERPVGSVVITGELEERVFMTFEQLEALPLPVHTVSVTFQSGQTVEQHTFTGFLLHDVLNLLKPRFDPEVRNDRLRFYVSATATDDYQAIVAWGELDPGFGNKAILLAFAEDGESLLEPAEVLSERRAVVMGAARDHGGMSDGWWCPASPLGLQ
jgi:hypothetical protein